jgi:hypothetical protein
MVIRKKVSRLRTRITELQSLITDAELNLKKFSEEKAHAEYTLRMLAEFDTSPVKNIPNLDTQSESSKKEAYKQIAEENMGKIMSTQEILDQLKKKGVLVAPATHYANLSRYDDDPRMPIKRVSTGQYEFRPEYGDELNEEV